jgi:alpha-L-fucosidase 2
MARLGDGEACYANVLELFKESIRPNLFDVCGLKENSPFQIDGNLGAPAGFVEMLLQSHGITPLTPPAEGHPWPADELILRLLPALPKAWLTGSFRGFKARGGIEIDCHWQDGMFQSATLRFSSDQSLKLVLPAATTNISIRTAGLPHDHLAAQPDVSFTARAGETIRIESVT